jgi:hypothetical protein
MSKRPELPLDPDSPEARRDFLTKCSRFAAVTPPAMTLLRSVSSVPRKARASIIGHGHGKGKERGSSEIRSAGCDPARKWRRRKAWVSIPETQKGIVRRSCVLCCRAGSTRGPRQ